MFAHLIFLSYVSLELVFIFTLYLVVSFFELFKKSVKSKEAKRPFNLGPLDDWNELQNMRNR